MTDVLVYPSDLRARRIDADPDPFASESLPPPPAPMLSDVERLSEEVFANIPDEPPAEEVPRPAVQYLGTAGLKSHSLLFPVKVGDKRITKVIISPPALWDVQDWINGKIASNFELLSRMTGLDTMTLGALRWPDVQELLNITTDLLPSFVKDGIERQGRGS